MIRLASAIGEQREPIDVLGGIDNAINKAGDAIRADIAKKKEASAKQAEQDQKLKDLLTRSIKVIPPKKGFPKDKEYYKDIAMQGLFNVQKASLDPKKSATEIEDMKTKYEFDMANLKNKIESDYDAVRIARELSMEKKTHDASLFENILTGRENPTQVAEMPNDDFMAASEADRAGKMVGENGMKATETKTIFQSIPYFDKPMEERMKMDLTQEMKRLVIPKKVGIEKAAKGYYGDDFDFQSFTNRTDKQDPKTGQFIYDFDEKKVDLDAKRFATSMLGKGNFGSKDHSIQQAAYEQEALVAGNEAGFTGDKLADFVEKTVYARAYDDFTEAARVAAQKRMMNDKEVIKAPSKGIDITFTSGGGGSSKIWNIGDAQEKPLYEVKDGKKTNKVIGDYYYHAIQTAAAGENPKKFNIAGNTDVQIEGINVNKKTGKPEYIDITIPAKYDSYGDKIPNTGIKKTVRITEDTEIENLRTNLGKNLYDKTIGAHKPMKEEKEKAKPKEVTNYGNRIDGTPKGKGYFGELKMDDGSVATEITINFGDVLGGALIPSLVPTLTESEKKYLLKGNKPTKEIALKAIRHAEERASKGLSPFVDGGELKSKSGKPIYWDKTAKTYKYK